MNIICVDPQNDPLWRKLVECHESDVFHAPGWIRALNQTYGFDIRALIIADDKDTPRAGLVYSKIKDMRDSRIISLPFSDFCDPLVKDREDWHSLLDGLLEEGCPITLKCLHNDVPLHDERLQLLKRAKWHCVDLHSDIDALWYGLHSSARRAIRKAQKDGVVVQIAQDKEQLRAFFDLHLRVRKYKYRLLAQPYRFFENIWDNAMAEQQGVLMLALYRDEIIGGVLFIEWQGKFYYKFNASNPDYISLRPNDIVIWEAIKYGQAKGYTYLDFGLSDWDQEGLVRYKRKFATEEKTISYLRYTNNEQPSVEAKQLGNLFPQLTQLFTDDCVPDHITEKAGELLYKFFA